MDYSQLEFSSLLISRINFDNTVPDNKSVIQQIKGRRNDCNVANELKDNKAALGCRHFNQDHWFSFGYSCGFETMNVDLLKGKFTVFSSRHHLKLCAGDSL